ncbi:MAG: hypothetical protein PHT59_05835, partial [Candidatus Omnitrophica bacterium]|nr:hypothetical protein [Candidatus Omnitrophota bacterium]
FFVADHDVLTSGEILALLAEGVHAPRPLVLSGPVTSALAKLPYVGQKVAMFLKDRVYDVAGLERLGLRARMSAREALLRTAAYYRS